MDAPKNRWLPPSPHREEVLKRIQAGRAHIQERGHNVPPLLVFEDGGVIELPRVRYEMTRRGMELVSGNEAPTEGQTKHNDVCGTVDEIKGLMKEQPELAREKPEVFNGLLDDAAYMLSRMRRRCDAYRAFADALASAVQTMVEVKTPDTAAAIGKVEAFRHVLSTDPDAALSRRQELDALAEGVRNVANGLERTLRAYKAAAMNVSDLLDEIKGGRVWATEKKEGASSH